MVTSPLASISTRLTAFVIGLTLIIVVLAAVAVVGLTFVNDNAQHITNRWLKGTQILGEVSGEVSEFRIAESYRVLALKPDYESEADALANHHRDAIAFLLDRYRMVVGPELPTAEFASFTDAWSRYLSGHDRWVASAADAAQDSPALAGSELNDGFLEADKDVKILIAANQAAAAAQARQADLHAQRAIVLVVLAVFGAITLALALVRQVFSQIRNPLRSITAALSDLASGALEIKVPQLNRRDEIGEMALAFEVFRTNAVALAEARQLADDLASYDALTGLANRRLFSSLLADRLARAANGPDGFAIMILDLDRFKLINDTRGHAIGDLVLREVGARLRATVGRHGTVARLGGDEFAIVLADVLDAGQDTGALRALASAIVAALREPMGEAGDQLDVGVSLGIALFPGDGADAEALLRAADLAMYQAKKEGVGWFRFFEPAMVRKLEIQSALEADLREALHNGGIRPFFQPIVDLAASRIAGFEILARWRHPERGEVPPEVFVPLLEDLGLSGALTAGLLGQACRHARQWGRRVPLALAVSHVGFQDPALPTLILAVLAQEGFAPHDLTVGVTETAILQDVEAAKRTLATLRESGIAVALDDFGTGHSSLRHLGELGFDKLKIDRRFVQSMHRGPAGQKIVASLLQLARSLGVATIAKGIEDAAAIQDLIGMGCDFGQGPPFSQAVEPAKVPAMLAKDGGASVEPEPRAA